ncbi:polar amino acid transport system substrate-binding protein [Clostridium tetanomorphum]|uniref:ABC transporter substrate-binding protein n=1 Tax=Clostridium tetanomorphum TaxID=1553 RepID=UPI00044D8140|nr:ABC transporter substrate-binding protein [Clostridium tetanomorphum]KAJ52812.1 lysine-arginine-ornithine-binding extracellular protein [Clostridium tetanomorphum DSM 665]MBP1865397.1 polar amino acid transport system substrate-binding protein [Clostridium tetanomorphum]NRS84836.1 polar amino acid transport system substrate-binding protein [Clostridium tetanomorphum]SQB91656.1 lysine-arginine-ornithine-binding extracellular protein [Clostridium tetanomorphum]
MKKAIKFFITMLILGSVLGGCASKKEDLNLLQSVKKNKKIVIGIEEGYPPMEFRDENKDLVGFDVDFGKELGKRLGVTPEFSIVDFNGLIMALNSKKFDIAIASISITDKRKESIDFSKPYIVGGQIIAVKKGNKSINEVKDLQGKVLACQLGTTGDNVAANMKGIKSLKKYDKITEAFHELSANRVDAVIMDAQVGAYYMGKKKGEYEILDGIISKEPMGIGYRKEDKELREEIDKIIDDMEKDGTLSKLSMKWFGYDAYKEKLS